MLFVAYSIYVDIDATGARVTTWLPYLLLFVALLTALWASALMLLSSFAAYLIMKRIGILR
jgi:hypothetical protein